MTGAEVRHQLELGVARKRMTRDLIELKAEAVVLEASGDSRLTEAMRARLDRCVARVDELITLAGSVPRCPPSVKRSSMPSPSAAGPALSLNQWRVV